MSLKKVVQVSFISGVLAASLMPCRVVAESTPKYYELLLTVDHGTVTLSEQTLRDGHCPGPQRPLFCKGCWVVQAQDDQGTVLYTSTMTDPRHWHADHFVHDPSEPGRVQGHRKTRAGTQVTLQLPYNPAMRQVKLYRLKRDVVVASAMRSASAYTLPSNELQPLGSVNLATTP